MSYNQFAQDTQQQNDGAEENVPLPQVENLASLDALLMSAGNESSNQQQQQQTEQTDYAEQVIQSHAERDAEDREIDALNRFDVDALDDDDDGNNNNNSRSNGGGIIVDFGGNQDEDSGAEQQDDDEDDEDEDEDEVVAVDASPNTKSATAAATKEKQQKGKTNKKNDHNNESGATNVDADAAAIIPLSRAWTPVFHENILKKLLGTATEGMNEHNKNKPAKAVFSRRGTKATSAAAAAAPTPLTFSRDALRAVNCSVELILKDLANECVKVTRRRGLKTISYDTVADVCSRIDRFAFLSDVIPSAPLTMVGGNRVVNSKTSRAAKEAAAKVSSQQETTAATTI